jgi:hypothetical protein
MRSVRLGVLDAGGQRQGRCAAAERAILSDPHAAKTELARLAAALAHRLHMLGLMSEWSYRGVFIELSKRGRARESNGIERETSQVFAKVFSSLKGSGTTKADIARELGLYTDDLDALIFGLSMMPVTEGRRTADVNAAARRRHLKLHR